ncbi:Major Facilitator Superfamily [Geosmithia morbida]|uniref:Major Facilitator Superfamily n=1 Tax=Geosmithia morbida TaxID=1094350 RepID=A0A9P4Z2M7_9HYPO|nr:Major Facilitator Superfamily [Geosmithia morbida]KAF4126103.1 Major Facilitator Superfamily [Geosmithia morbida]
MVNETTDEKSSRVLSSPSSSSNRSTPPTTADPEKKDRSERRGSQGRLVTSHGPGEEVEGVPHHHHKPSLSSAPAPLPQYTDDGKRIISEDECEGILGYAWPTWKKWMLLTSIVLVQISMNFNTSVYPNVVTPLTEAFGVSETMARLGQCLFLILYAFGCELWAPWSEEFGRWRVLQISLFFVNVWQILAALAPNIGTILVARSLGGLSSAGGSVTLGMVADLYGPDDQQWAVAYVVMSSVVGTSIGPVVGGPIQKFLSWHWNFWIQLIFGLTVQAIHLFMPESRSTIIMDREAKRRRSSGEEDNVYGPNEVKRPRISLHEFGITWIRPFEMFLREPIVLSCSLLSGFSDALIFTFQEGYKPVYQKWGFGVLQIAWAFIPINIGYAVAYASYVPWIRRDQHRIRTAGADSMAPEFRLKWLLWLAPLETIGLFGFAWTSMGPPESHWIGPMVFSFLIAVANYAIYMSTIDYMIAAYGVYSASATGGNGFARDFLAGISSLYATPLYGSWAGDMTTQYASTILGCIAAVVLVPVYVIYWKGPEIRIRSKFAESLDAERKDKERRRSSAAPVIPQV